MRLIFAGTPFFARHALSALIDIGHDVALVLTQPDRPAGRGLKLQPSPVKDLAIQQGIPVLQPQSLRVDGRYAINAQSAKTAIEHVNADAMVVVAYGLILPAWALQTPRLGCFNIHASLLPRWRGAAPIQRAIEAGDTETGIAIMQMDTGLDTGDIVVMQSLAINEHETCGALHDRLAQLGASLMVGVLSDLATGNISHQTQPTTGVCYAHKIEKSEAVLDWALPAHTLHRRILAFNPAPGASTCLDDQSLKIWRSEQLATPGMQSHLAQAPGTIIQANERGVMVVCGGGGCLLLTELQKPGAKRMAAVDFLRGFELKPGMRFH